MSAGNHPLRLIGERTTEAVASAPDLPGQAVAIGNSALGLIRSSVRAATGLVLTIADPVVQGVADAVLDRLDLAMVAQRIADQADVALVAQRVVDAVNVTQLANDVADTVDVDPIIERVDAKLAPMAQAVLEGLDFDPVLEGVIGRLDIAALVEDLVAKIDLRPIITDALRDVDPTALVRAAVRRPAK